MQKKPLHVFWLTGAMLLLASLACNALTGNPTPTATSAQPTGGGMGEVPTAEPGGEEPTATADLGNGGNPETEFPLPDDVQNFAEVGGTINFQTSLGLEETLAFYRAEFTSQGYTEREILTSITDTVFSIVFDGHPSGDAVVVQAVDMQGTTNVNIRLEPPP